MITDVVVAHVRPDRRYDAGEIAYPALVAVRQCWGSGPSR